jgi:hypothetical protein
MACLLALPGNQILAAGKVPDAAGRDGNPREPCVITI